MNTKQLRKVTVGIVGLLVGLIACHLLGTFLTWDMYWATSIGEWNFVERAIFLIWTSLIIGLSIGVFIDKVGKGK